MGDHAGEKPAALTWYTYQTGTAGTAAASGYAAPAFDNDPRGGRPTNPAARIVMTSQLIDTRRAFDSVAAHYDGPTGNNALIQRMRGQMWNALTDLLPAGARVLDLGCGTGIDSAYLAARGYRVLAIDWSAGMVARTQQRIKTLQLESRVQVRHLGIHELSRLAGEPIDAMFSNLGPLNCVPDLGAVARDCAAMLAPGAPLLVSMIGRICPWEIAYYLAHGQPGRALIRTRAGSVPVGLN